MKHGKIAFLFRILDAQHFRRYPILDHNNDIIPIANNIEPVSVTISPNGQQAYVAMPVSNSGSRGVVVGAVAVILAVAAVAVAEM